MYHLMAGGCAVAHVFRFSFFVFRALAHCLIYAAVAALALIAPLLDRKARISPQSPQMTSLKASQQHTVAGFTPRS